jgi:hypothetical protein
MVLGADENTKGYLCIEARRGGGALSYINRGAQKAI